MQQEFLFSVHISYIIANAFTPFVQAASARQTMFRGYKATGIKGRCKVTDAVCSYNPRAALNPYTNWAKIIDCKIDCGIEEIYRRDIQIQGE